MKSIGVMFYSYFRFICLPFCLLFIVASNVVAQKPELVPEYEKNLREASTDSARAMALQYLAFNLAHTDPKRSVAYGNEALQVAEKSGNAWLLSQCQNGVGWAFFSGGNYARARTLLDSSIQYMRATQDYFDLAPVCNNQGWICLKQGDNLGALRYFREGLNAAEASKDKGRIAFMNRSLGSFYNAQKEFDKSIPHIQRALEIFTALRDTGSMNDCLFSLGNAYSGMGQNETAIDYYKKTLPIAQQNGDVLGEALIYENWGMALSSLGKFEEAFEKMEQARRLLEQLDEQIELAFLDLTIGNAHLMKGDTAQAIAPFEKARRISTKLQINDVLTELLPSLHAAYASIGSPEKAYQTLLAYQKFRDTTAAEANSRDLQRLKTEFETERKEKDLQIKTLENKHLQSRFWLALAGFGVALMAGFAFWYRARQRRKTNAALELKNLEILAQKTEAERLRERAEQSEAVKEKFLAAMSHEIRTPMNAILGLSQLLDAGQHEPTVAHNISIIRQSSEHLMTILNDVLDLAKIEAHKIELRPQPMALIPQLQFILDTFTARAREKGIDFRLETSPNLPSNVMADPVRFGQVLNNLVSNAIKFTKTGEVVLSAKCQETGKTQNSLIPITFSVRDTGIGIPQEKQATVFEEFTQADSGIAITYGGTGLGLSIARSLVQQMGGSLELSSKPGQGATFFFTLNMPTADPERMANQLKNEGQTHIPKLVNTTPVHVLLIEDNSFNQAVAAQTIAAICPEIKLDIADCGEQALDRIKTKRFDLILTDLQMPGIDGYETARRLRLAHIEAPIVALTASAARTEESKCLEAGMQEMLLKPIAPSEMAALLLRYIPQKLVLESTAAPAEDGSIQSRPIPPALLHYAGKNQEMARQLLEIIRTELSEHLPCIRQLRSLLGDTAIRKRVHKIRPQILALGLQEHIVLFDAIEQNPTADAEFWANVRTLETILQSTLADL